MISGSDQPQEDETAGVAAENASTRRLRMIWFGMAKDSPYITVTIETYENRGEPAAERIRARPVAGQGLPTTMKVECSARMRNAYPVGTGFRIQAKVTDREGGTKFLYTHYSWPYVVEPSGTSGSQQAKPRKGRSAARYSSRAKPRGG